MRFATVAAALAVTTGCSSDGPRGVGTVVYSEHDSNHIRVLDLASGADQLIDDGAFGSVSIAPDAQHVAYVGGDRVVKIADRARTITPIVPRSGCNGGTGNWVTNTALLYCIDSPQQRGSMLLPALDGVTPRFFENSPSVSADGTQVAYIDAHGNLVVERIDGSDPRVLVPSADPTALFSYRYASMFTPDQRAVLMEDASDYPIRTRIVSLADGTSIDVDDAWFPGTPFVTVGGGSVISPDGSEVVMTSRGGLIVVSLATGATRTLATYPERISSAGAVFLDDGRVAWLRYEDRSVGDLGDFYLSIHVAGPGTDDDALVLDSHDESWPSVMISPTGFVAVAGAELLVSMDGTVLVRNDTSSETAFHADILGISADGTGVVTSSSMGDLRFVGLDGTVRDLVTTSPWGSAGDLWGPYAAFTRATP